MAQRCQLDAPQTVPNHVSVTFHDQFAEYSDDLMTKSIQNRVPLKVSLPMDRPRSVHRSDELALGLLRDQYTHSNRFQNRYDSPHDDSHTRRELLRGDGHASQSNGYGANLRDGRHVSQFGDLDALHDGHVTLYRGGLYPIRNVA